MARGAGRGGRLESPSLRWPGVTRASDSFCSFAASSFRAVFVVVTTGIRSIMVSNDAAVRKQNVFVREA